MNRARAWLRILREHPLADAAVLVFLILSVGSVRWLSRPTVFIKVDGVSHRVHPTGKTVAEVLAEQHIVLGAEDFSIPPPETPLSRNAIVQVKRVTHKVESRLRSFPPKIYWRVQLKSNLRPVLVERGYMQVDSETVRSTYYDGVKSSEKVLKRKSGRRPVFSLTLFDRKTGRPSKVYDLSQATKLSMRATGYYVGEKYVPSDTTFLGYKLRRGLVAVDPKVIPLRSRLYVKGYGYAYAADTGSAIKGNRIDLAVKDRREEQQFNRHRMTVYVLEKARTW